MPYDEGYEPKPVLTQGMEDTTSIISNLSPPFLQLEFLLPPQQSHPISNMVSLLDSPFSEHKEPPPPEQEANVGTGGESSNPGGYPHQSTGHC